MACVKHPSQGIGEEKFLLLLPQGTQGTQAKLRSVENRRGVIAGTKQHRWACVIFDSVKCQTRLNVLMPAVRSDGFRLKEQ